MDGSAIQDLLNQCISGGVLTLKAGANPLGSTRIDALLTGVFGGTLTATPGDAQVGADSVAYPSASLQSESFVFYPKAAAVAAVLTVTTGSGGMLDLSLSATMPGGWALTDSFTAIGVLPASPLKQIVAASGVIAVDSADSAVNAVVTAELTTAGSTLAQLQWLLGATVQVSGAAGFVTGPSDVAYPQLTLSSTKIQGPDISGFSFDVFVNLRSAAGPPPLADGSWPLVTSVDLTVDLVTPALTLPILIAVSGADQTQYPVSLDPYSPAPSITSLSQLEGFTWGQTVALSTDTPIGTLSLPALSVVFDAANRSLGSLQVTVDLGTDWTIVQNLELVGLSAQLYVPVVWGGTPPQGDGASFAISVTAEFIIVTADIDVTVAYPAETVSLALAPATVIDINDFMNALAPGLKLPGTGDLTIETLSAVADIKQSVYSVSASASGDLSIIPGFVLTSIDTAMTWANSAVESFQFGAGFTIAKAPLSMCVTYASNNWAIAGGSAPEAPINLSDLVADIASIFGVILPSNLPEIVLSPLEMSYQTIDGSFAFNATVSYFTGDDPVLTSISGTLNINYDGKAQAWTGEVSGTIVLDETNNFTVAYDFKTDQVVSLSWTATGGESIGINDLCHLFGASDMQDMIPPDLDLALVQVIGKYDITTQSVVFECKSSTWGVADVVVWNDKTSGWSIYFGVNINVDISLTDIPLIGKVLASVVGEVTLNEIEAGVSNIDLTAAQATAITGEIDAGYPTPPAGGLPSGGALVMVFDAGGQTTRISLGTTDSTGGPPAPIPPGTGPSVPGAPGTPAVSTASDGTKWFSLQKNFGPVSIQKVGVRYSDSKLWALMNASITAGGLTIETLGLGVGSPLTTFDPSFTVDGIVVSLSEGPVSFSGGLIGTLAPVNLYGELSIDFGPFTIGAIAGYAEYQDQPSFFMYGVLNAPLGGPGFFFVTGLAAGFGLNRSLIVPDVSGVYQFPLVQWAVGINAPSSDPAGDIGQQVADTMNTLASSGVIAPNIGEYWFAAGISFTSYELVDSFALATIEFGNDLEIDLLGLSTMAVPPSPSPPVAEAQLALKATIQPSTGLIGISGQLTPNSYVLSKSCKLTGGFAIYLWVSGDYAGQFVMTLGGYSPNFLVPKYYPQVPRLGLQWTISSCLSVTGDLYFALTSSAVMAGGGLSAVWQAGDIRAWFDVETDFLMVFTPFHYYLSGSIELGASVRINLLFTHVTISIHLGVGVQIWGPSFSGEIDVDLSIVSFTISFGSGQQGGDTTILWNDFVQQLIPSQASPSSSSMTPAPAMRQSLMARKRMMLAADTDPPPPAVLQIVGLKGVLQTLSTEEGQLNWLVDGQTFQLQVQTTIPLKTYTLDGPGVGLAATGQPPGPQNIDFGCGPAGVANGDFSSAIVISATSTEDSVFDAVMVLSNVAKALWELRSFDSHATPQNVDPVNDTTIDNVLTGFTLIPTVPPPDQTPLPIPLQYLQYTIDPNIQSFSWSVPVVETSDPFTPSQTVASTIAAAPATSNRPALLAAMLRAQLDVAQSVDVSTLAAANSNYLLAEPELRYLGEAK